MEKSQRLRLGEVRAALRLVGECRDLGYDPALWRRHAFERLSGLAGARVVMGGEAHWPRPDGPITPILPVFLGMSQAVEGSFICHVRERGLVAEAIGRLPGRLVTRTRRQLLADRAWYRSPQYDGLHRPNGIDHCVLSVWELPGELTDLIGLHRAAGERDFSDRESNLLRLVHDELGRLIGPVLVSAGDPFSPSRLPPRVRETLRCLLEGDGEKQAAARMGLSRDTVHQYVKTLYHHYQVASRAELLARVLRRTNPGG